jgi:hypothetical protein
MKIIAFYLPQYHQIPENDDWWGEGFTEWTTLKKAEVLFKGQNQPRIPLHDNYYDLTEKESIRWQIDIAKENNIFGFCIYHYWFKGKLLLEKPIEILLNDTSLDIPFCLCWANENWTRAWESKSNEILISQKYGDKNDWENHFNYFLRFFKDKRYIKEDGKPLLVIYRPQIITHLDEMLEYWNELAKKNNFPGIKYAYQAVQTSLKSDKFSYNIEYQPNYTRYFINKDKYKLLKKIKYFLVKFLNKLNINIENLRPPGLVFESYDQFWEMILAKKVTSETSIPGAFIDWDNTPRRGQKGIVMQGASPDKFKKYFKRLVIKTRNEYKKDKIFIFSWNEWTEGGYLEPDTKFGYKYLNAIKSVLEDLKEVPIREEK